MKTCAWLLSLLLTAAVVAAEPATQSAPRRFTLHAAPATRPALGYRLFPDPIDMTPGNAATLYLIGTSHNLMGNSALRQKFEERSAPDRELPRNDAEELLKAYHAPLHQLDLAARREECHWDLPSRIDGFGTLLPYLSDLRFLSRLLALQARVQITDGKYADASHTLQTGFAMARHLNSDAFVIQMLVGASISSMMLEQVEFWIQTPGSPNLYWALTDLPVPLADARIAIRSERAAMGYLPYFKEAAEGKLTSEHLHELVSIVAAATKGDSPDVGPALFQTSKDLVAARQWLADSGRKQETLDAMQPSQLLGLYYTGSYDQWLQELSKWCDLPYAQGQPGLERAEVEFAKARASNPGSLAFALVPTMGRVYVLATNLDRHVAELRVLEGVRAHAAAHHQPPASLGTLMETPAPIDPITGVGFHYEVSDGTITLDAPVPAGGRPQDGRRYELKIAP